MLIETICLPTSNQTVHFSAAMIQVLLVNMSHIYDFYGIKCVSLNGTWTNIS